MSRVTKRVVLFAGIGVLALVGAAARPAVRQIDQEFDADEAVQLLTVELTVAEDAGELSEPLALDLGLGFPFWLIPMESEAPDSSVFGAIPQRATVSRSVRAGERATFTFDVQAVEGADVLRSTPQLLADVRVSDISRIGLCAKGASDWGLESLEVRINGKVFHSVENAFARIQDEQALAQVRLRDLAANVLDLESQAESLRELAATGLATDEELQQLGDIGEVLLPQLQEQNRIERQLAGSYPWFLCDDFHSPWRNGHLIESLSVTVITAPHTGADTQNFVYYSTGGRQYLLSSPLNPMTAESGPQTFELDLIGGPATAGDLRAYSIGVLGSGLPTATVPDRLHVERLLVEVDGRIVYDSDDNELDRLSLEATRIIPPAHLDEAGGLVLNTPAARETYLWEAGRGTGLDLVNGGAETLPDVDDPAWPDPEPGLVYDEEWASAEYHDGFTEGFGPFPGETVFEEEWSMSWEDPWGSHHGWGPGSDPWMDDPWGGDPWGGDPWGGDPWGWTPPSSWLDLLAGMVFEHMGIDPAMLIEEMEEIDADPIGEPVQVENVRIDVGGFGMFQVEWDVVGDDSGVDNYLVELIVLRPHRLDPFGPVFYEGLALATDRTHVAMTVDEDVIDAELADNPYGVYLIPSVSVRFVSDDEYGPGQLGPAVPLTAGFSHPLHAVLPEYEYDGPWLGEPTISYGTSAASRAVWLPGVVVSHTGFAISGEFGMNVVMKPAPGDGWLRYTFYCTDALTMPTNLVMHVGLLDEVSELPDTATFTLSGVLHPADGSPDVPFTDGPVTVGPFTADDPEPMKWVELLVEPTTPGAIEVTVQVTGGDADPAHPPAIAGLRVLPVLP